MAEPVALGAYRRLRVPTLLLAGAASPATTRRIVALLAQTLAHVREQVVAGAGHMLPLTHRDAVDGAILEHLDRHAARVRVAA